MTGLWPVLAGIVAGCLLLFAGGYGLGRGSDAYERGREDGASEERDRHRQIGAALTLTDEPTAVRHSGRFADPGITLSEISAGFDRIGREVDSWGVTDVPGQDRTA